MYHLNQNKWSFICKLVILIRIEDHKEAHFQSYEMQNWIVFEEFLFDANEIHSVANNRYLVSYGMSINSKLSTSHHLNWFSVMSALDLLMTKPTKCHVRPAKTQSAWVSAQSDQSLPCPHEESLGP